MEPQPPLPLANGHGNSIVDRDVWLACAAPLSRLPTVGDDVYYFPDGHAEQCPAHLPAPLPAPHFFPCTVTDISLATDDKTDELFAKISLRLGPPRFSSGPRQQHVSALLPLRRRHLLMHFSFLRVHHTAFLLEIY